MFRKLKYGFTLSEVLITLGIIGVVAAMTLPALMTKYKKHEAVTRLKKSYTIINQALKLSEAQNGEYQYWETGLTPETYLEKYWVPYIKVIQICTTPLKCGYKSNGPWTRPNGDGAYAIFSEPSWRIPFLTADGLLYSISILGGIEDGKNIILIDINGASKPNVFGNDFFMFTRDERGLIRAYGYDKTPQEIDEDCTQMGQRYYCAAKIMKDGWEIKNGYPW